MLAAGPQTCQTSPADQVDVRIISGYSHLDVENADPNPVVPLTLAWLKTLPHR